MTLMQQYEDAKKRHPNMLLLFPIGDFYEVYGDDATVVAKLLGLSLTSRTYVTTGKTLLMAGFPHHVLESHLHTLLKAGSRVAICEQVDEPSLDTPGKTAQPSLFE